MGLITSKFKIISILCFLLFAYGTTIAQVPGQITFQGMLENADSAVDGTLDMTFRLYGAETGGTPLWEEAQAVLVIQGLYNVMLGTGTLNPTYDTLEATLVSTDSLWLEVHISGDTDPMTPRQKMTSVGFAIRSGVADTVPDSSITAAQLATGAVTTEKLADGSVTAVKVTGGFVPNLDADKLDNMDSADFALSTHAHDTRYYSKAEVDALVNGYESRINALERKLVSLAVSDDGKDLTFSGVNIHVVNGTNSTGGAANGVGNIIVGYNEERSEGNDRTGSHNIVVGQWQNYSSDSGLVAGSYNTISGVGSSVSGGWGNTASGAFSSVSGGNGNTASNHSASVGGGAENTASGNRASVIGGQNNTASGVYSFVGGGGLNSSVGEKSSVVAGHDNEAHGSESAILGGAVNDTWGQYATVVGGGGNRAFGRYSLIVGGTSNQVGSTVSIELGNLSVVLGGQGNIVTGDDSVIGGGAFNYVEGFGSAILGGYSNNIFSTSSHSVISGGDNIEMSINNGYMDPCCQ